MNVYIVKHWCEAEVIGVFDSESEAMKCIERNKPPAGSPSWMKEEYDVLKYELNKDDDGELIYKAAR